EILGHGQAHGPHADEANARHLDSPTLTVISIRLWGERAPLLPQPPAAPLRRLRIRRIRRSPRAGLRLYYGRDAAGTRPRRAGRVLVGHDRPGDAAPGARGHLEPP